MERRLRVTAGLVFTVGDDGRVWVWQPRRRTHTGVAPDQLALLVRFGDGATIDEVAEAAGFELDDAVVELVAGFEEAGLVSPVEPPLPPQPVRHEAQARIAELVDPGSFVEQAGGPIITGIGSIDGRRVAIAAWQPGATDGIEEVLQLQERVAAEPCPVIYLLDLFSIGRRAADFASPRSIGRIYANQARLGVRVPQIAVVHGALWRPAALLPAGCDLVVFVDGAGFVHLGDPGAVKDFTGEDITSDALGGARVHAEHSGLAHLVAATSSEAAAQVRRYLGYVASEAGHAAPSRPAVPPPSIAPAVLDALVPADADTPFAIAELVRALCDDGSVLELRARHARELTTSLARLGGTPVGVIANCCQHKAGILSVEAADKATRFVQLCDLYRVPVVFLVDVLGFAIGSAAERAGIELAAARLFAAIARATTKKLVLVVRRAHTAGLFGMAGPAFDPDAFIALPTASISIFSERGRVAGLAQLERLVDPSARAGLRSWIRDARSQPADHAELVVPASEARAALIARLS